MKKLFAIFAALSIYSMTYALPVYNPEEPALIRNLFICCETNWGFELGYRGDFVFDRQLQIKTKINIGDLLKKVNDYRRSTNAAQVTLNLWDWLDVYGWVGGAQTSFEAQVQYASLTIIPGALTLSNFSGQTKEEFAYGCGVRGILWKCGLTAIGIDLQYAHARARFENLNINGIPVEDVLLHFNTSSPVTPGQFSLRTQEYQAAIGISHRIGCLIPYATLKMSRVKGGFNGPLFTQNPVQTGVNYSPRLRLRSQRFVGFALGATFIDDERFQVTAEARFIDEKAMTIAGGFRF